MWSLYIYEAISANFDSYSAFRRFTSPDYWSFLLSPSFSFVRILVFYSYYWNLLLTSPSYVEIEDS
jgi:hypothetical protein